jgi:phospholipid/cholesterol/gamma-HCH transport system substrate-binding protein
VEEGTARFNENMEAMRSNWLFRGYFKKMEKQAAKEKSQME